MLLRNVEGLRLKDLTGLGVEAAIGERWLVYYAKIATTWLPLLWGFEDFHFSLWMDYQAASDPTILRGYRAFVLTLRVPETKSTRFELFSIILTHWCVLLRRLNLHWSFLQLAQPLLPQPHKGATIYLAPVMHQACSNIQVWMGNRLHKLKLKTVFWLDLICIGGESLIINLRSLCLLIWWRLISQSDVCIVDMQIQDPLFWWRLRQWRLTMCLYIGIRRYLFRLRESLCLMQLRGRVPLILRDYQHMWLRSFTQASRYIWLHWVTRVTTTLLADF